MAIFLAPLDERHLQNMLHWLGDVELRDHIGTVFPITMARHREWYQGLVHDRSQVVMAIEDGSTHIGTIGLRNIDLIYRNAELWLYIGEQDRRGGGVARPAFDQIVAFAFQTLNLHRVYANVFGFNERAKRFFAKAGMRHEGVLREAAFKKGCFCDKHVFGLLESEFQPARAT